MFLPRSSHGQRSLAGGSPWGCKEPDTDKGAEHARVRCTTLPISWASGSVPVTLHIACIEAEPSLPCVSRALSSYTTETLHSFSDNSPVSSPQHPLESTLPSVSMHLSTPDEWNHMLFVFLRLLHHHTWHPVFRVPPHWSGPPHFLPLEGISV